MNSVKKNKRTNFSNLTMEKRNKSSVILFFYRKQILQHEKSPEVVPHPVRQNLMACRLLLKLAKSLVT